MFLARSSVTSVRSAGGSPSSRYQPSSTDSRASVSKRPAGLDTAPRPPSGRLLARAALAATASASARWARLLFI